MVVVGLAVILPVEIPPLLNVAAGVHVYEMPPFPVRVVLCPLQIVAVLELMIGKGNMVSVLVTVDLHPVPPSKAVTV